MRPLAALPAAEGGGQVIVLGIPTFLVTHAVVFLIGGVVGWCLHRDGKQK